MQRLLTREVRVGNITIGGKNPVRIQTMTTTDTMDTAATVEQCVRCINAGAELVRITAPSKKEAENLRNIKEELHKRGYTIPLVADIHFTPNAAEIAAGIVEKVRVNPGNYVDKKKFEQIEYSEEEYREEIERIRERFTPLIQLCQMHGTAMRIGTNHGSLSDRIMSRYGDTAIGMVESAMEFLRIARDQNYHQIVLSMKSSNPQVMIEAYRTLVQHMMTEFGECYPMHLGVTEAGDGEDGRIKSAIGIGTLLQEGIGDTIRVSLTEEPELELPVCRDIVERYEIKHHFSEVHSGFIPEVLAPSYPIPSSNMNQNNYWVISDLSKYKKVEALDLSHVGYNYKEEDDKWHISDQAADFIFCNEVPMFALPGSLGVISYYQQWLPFCMKENCFPLFDILQYIEHGQYVHHDRLNFVMLDARVNAYPDTVRENILRTLQKDPTVVLCLYSAGNDAISDIRSCYVWLNENNVQRRIICMTDNSDTSLDKALIHYSVEAGSLLLEGKVHGVSFGFQFGNNTLSPEQIAHQVQTLNSISFGILQATRKRISKTEYISCPSCGRTLFNLQETTARIRSVTHHLKGVKIAIMGCIVNGPGEMADADFGYVGSGVGKITLYKNKDIVKRNIDSDVAVEELIDLLKANGAWQDPS